MEWSDQGIVLSVRGHGETAAIVSLMSRERGRHLGLVHGGQGRRMRGILQPGNLLDVRWRARLSEHLGSYSCELTRAYSGGVFDDALKLHAMSAALGLVDAALPEREPHGPLFERLTQLLGDLQGEDWQAGYVRFEIDLLRELGFGLDLSCCAATGTTEDLAFVSPVTGRAVSRPAAQPYRARLLPLPSFLIEATSGAGEFATGLALTAHFLERHVLAPHGGAMPAARVRLAQGFARLDAAVRRPGSKSTD
ncbi:MAG: DNA repair protein RecO [Rhodospirillales bacterium]|nr:DNA repair protein RecO [Rhodospirillales bacterium]